VVSYRERNDIHLLCVKQKAKAREGWTLFKIIHGSEAWLLNRGYSTETDSETFDRAAIQAMNIKERHDER
jgi:hypothetical protein